MASIQEQVTALRAQVEALSVMIPATEAELKDKFGDPEIRVTLKKWEGEDFKGRRMSEASPEFLEQLASFLRWAAKKEREDIDAGRVEDPEKAAKWLGYKLRDARLALGWAIYKRANSGPGVRKAAPKQDKHNAAKANGYAPPSVTFAQGDVSEDEIPF